MELAFLEDEPAGTLLLLDELKLSIPEWQKARRELGASPFRFPETSKDFKRLRERLRDILWLGLHFLWSLVLQERLVQP